ncbi:acyl-CoA thioesterase [Sinanaerobacter chloroacetimidivorans]|uniref:Acyl-CoA thioesterase n=1 Tax=Sinanaerobacter chloroacetimidivorans TaxID=2818044 RepID=A0A8J7W3Z3_9FIRM|nr:thioesterase family protein [Sinanaerobacter chloroacetimidivorans]MBR0598520.1 acyl-CoA thioesterase [Sinanaerobacter chloroacetimidivorans]
MKQIETKFNVRYSETDQMKIVHHSNYTIWFESGRSDFLKSVGISVSYIENEGILLPLYEMNCKFKKPARFEDEILVLTGLKRLSCARVIFTYKVFQANTNVLLATGETMHAWTNKSFEPVNAMKKIPEVYDILAGLLGANSEQ